MKNDKLLIFDLDDTLFETRSIGNTTMQTILDSFELIARQFYSENEIHLIIADLWQLPFDEVANKYKINESLSNAFSTAINTSEYQFKIHPFDDFKFVKQLKHRKYLVTTGFKKLQLAKISALGIENAFEEIIIDEIDTLNRVHKKGIFIEALKTNKISPKDIIVIGDNPNSELKAGYELGVTTVQVARYGQRKSDYANFYVNNFQALTDIVRRQPN